MELTIIWPNSGMRNGYCLPCYFISDPFILLTMFGMKACALLRGVDMYNQINWVISTEIFLLKVLSIHFYFVFYVVRNHYDKVPLIGTSSWFLFIFYSVHKQKLLIYGVLGDNSKRQLLLSTKVHRVLEDDSKR